MYEIAEFNASVSLESKRDQIRALEGYLMACEQAEVPIRHFFADGMYAREATVPKHCALTGAIHKRQHICILLRGDMTIVTEKGRQRIQAPHVMVCEAGAKRAGFAHEESVWITVHSCEAQDVEAAELETMTNDYSEFERYARAIECQV